MVVCRHCHEEIRQSAGGLWFSCLAGARTTNPWKVQRCEVGRIELHEPVLHIFDGLEAVEAWLAEDS